MMRPPVPAAEGLTDDGMTLALVATIRDTVHLRVSESTLCFLADSTRYGIVALSVL